MEQVSTTHTHSADPVLPGSLRRLYHYTSTFHLPMILSTGLSRGEIPLSPYRVEKGVWFTTDSAPSAGLHGLGRSLVDKLGVQIVVDFPLDAPLLTRWLVLARQKKVNRKWLDVLHAAGGGEDTAKTWWVYKGVITSDAFAQVNVKVNGLYEPYGSWR